MTLLLAHAARYGAIHVSDRLLTLASPTRPFDQFSNKAVLYLCTDAIIALAYTGVAYIGNRPTDDWIAQQLIGNQLPEHETFGLPMTVEHRDIGSAIEILRSHLDSDLPRHETRKVEVLISGWKWGQRSKGRRPEPFVAALLWNGERMVTHIPPRYWWFKRGRDEALGALPVSNMSRLRLEELMKRVTRCSDDIGIRDVLVEATRAVSAENAMVGEDCMSIMIPPPHLRRVEIEFISGGRNSPHGEVYSPWVITPNYVHRPSVLFGGWEIHSADWTFYLKDDVRGFAAWAKQTRPKWP